MQFFTINYLESVMKKENKRIDSLFCLENIPHEKFNDISFEKELDYEVLGIHWNNGTYIVMNDFGEVEEIMVGDPRFKVYKFVSGADYPTNFLLGIGMNQNNQWKWFVK